MQRGRAIGGVFLASGLILAWNTGAAGPATAWVDPVAKIQAQDEAVYAATSREMALGQAHSDSVVRDSPGRNDSVVRGLTGRWLTPRFLGRYALYKPPVLYWLSAAAIKLFGFKLWALRLPSILAGAGMCALVFAWVGEGNSAVSALTAVVLLLSSHLFFVLSRIALTDALLAFWITLALYALARDPKLDTRTRLWIFGAATGAAIMTKAVAGILPLFVLAACCVWPSTRVPYRRWFAAVGIAAAVALPWHLYQFWIHPHWFWSEYVLTEMFAWGTAAPSQTTQESHLLFYARRLWALDPVLLIAGTAALFRVRPRLLPVWVAVLCAEMLAFQYRNAAYLLPLYPALAVAAGCAIPYKSSRLQRVAIALAGVFFVAKAALPAQTWGLPFAPETVNPAYAALDAYAALHRGNELILVNPDDQFYSSLLHLPRVRYAYLDPSPDPGGGRPALPLDFEYLGITVTEPEFERLSNLAPAFAVHLRNFDLAVAPVRSNADVPPIGTVIRAKDEEEIGSLLRSRPAADFYIPERWAARDAAPPSAGLAKREPPDGGSRDSVHDLRPAHDARVFLLSREVIQRP
jgi:hypothetical protein